LDVSLAHSVIQDEAASQAAALESAMGFSRSFGWQYLRDAQGQPALFGKVANLFETSGVTGHPVCNERVNGNIPLAGPGPAAHFGEPATLGVGPEDQCLLVGGVDRPFTPAGTAELIR
jgi:hypothetical protein